MFIDASALAAILLGEPDAAALLGKIEAAEIRLTSPMAVWETALAISRNLKLTLVDSNTAIERFFIEFSIVSAPIPPETAALALQAFDRFGKGRHPAALNFGDCFAYACARQLKQPLLFKGDDFTLTDVIPA
jgi:ribonuclease VapC